MQMTGVPPMQTPARQASVCVQALPSLQAVPVDLKPLSVQLPVPLQVSWLTHAVPASPQTVPAGSSLARQVPLPLEVSGVVQSVSAGLPQAVPVDLNPLPVPLPAPLQVSWLTHAVPASPQTVPAGSSLARQVPLPLQVSGLVHSVSAGLPQAVPVDLKPSAGQPALLPVQFSATSQSLAEARQMVVGEAKVSAGQPLFTPSQLSSTSQGPAEARQTAVLFASAGQAALEPVQVSAGSQTPADGRQTVVLDLKPLSTQMPLPSQVS